ncbi:MAG: hypothetical protein RJB13_141 [Pseudomonadota bacterium]
MNHGQDGALLQCRSLELRVGYRSLIKNFELSLFRSEAVAIVGPNGLGKTTLLRTLCGISRPYRGEVLISGETLWPQKNVKTKRDVCLLASQPALFFEHSVLDNFEFYLRSLNREVDRATMMAALKQVALDRHAKQTARTLSTGQKRRLTLAILSLAQPQTVLLDEPTNGLDDDGSELCLSLLRTLVDNGSGLLIASHDSKMVGWCQRQLNLREWAS